ncbi:hypothetical protein RRG08_052929 [Elysia crispata]|uniref:Uncharacterized protein n=1 Tax=Elysia crispata TaxID=231223 RepID=A0AAE1DM36_9GAST|nr:hypothetical protein RRG08_052929 [Elysia crispata]
MGEQYTRVMGEQETRVMGEQDTRVMGEQDTRVIGEQDTRVMGEQETRVMGEQERRISSLGSGLTQCGRDAVCNLVVKGARAHVYLIDYCGVQVALRLKTHAGICKKAAAELWTLIKDQKSLDISSGRSELRKSSEPSRGTCAQLVVSTGLGITPSPPHPLPSVTETKHRQSHTVALLCLPRLFFYRSLSITVNVWICVSVCVCV